MWTRWFQIGRGSGQPDRAEAVAARAVDRASPGPGPLDPPPPADRPDGAFDARWRGAFRARVLIVLIVLGLWSAGVEARLVHLQVFRHQDMRALAQRQQKREVPLASRRGDIVDRNGQMLAYSVDG